MSFKNFTRTRTGKLSLSAFVLVGGGIGLGACGGSQQGQAIKTDQQRATQDLTQFEQAQPTPQFKYSQHRQNAIEIETAEATGAQTTTFFWNLGTQDPYFVCPSIGFPIAAQDQLKNPDQAVTSLGGSDPTVLPQIEPNGVYPGSEDGEYVICVQPDGKGIATFAGDGDVHVVTGPAVWDEATHQIKQTGPSSIVITKSKAEAGK